MQHRNVTQRTGIEDVMPNEQRVCVVVGVGPGNGAACVRRFAADGFKVAMLARSDLAALEKEIPETRAFFCDVSDEGSVTNALAQVKATLGDPEVVVYNAGSGVFANVENITAKDLEDAFRVNTLGLFHVSRAVIPAMKTQQRGAIIVIGATASRRGGKLTAAFAPAKAAQKSLCESMARHLWPDGIHIALVVVDGVIDLARTRKRMPDKPDDFFLAPDDIAATVAFLASQPRSAWAFELEARPFGEVW